MNNLLIWNIRGATNRLSVSRLRLLIRVHQVAVLVLLEPMAEAFNIESLRLKLSFDFCLFNPSNKIWVFWRCGFHFNVMHNSEQVLHVMAGHDSWTGTFFASFIYAKCTRVGRHALWSELRALASSITRPWLVGGTSMLSVR